MSWKDTLENSRHHFLGAFILMTDDLRLVGIAQNLLDPKSSCFELFFWIEPILLDVPRHKGTAMMT